MRRDPTEWRERVRLWKETGELLYEAGKKKELPKYEDGKGGYRYIQDDNGGWNRITNDLMSDLFANLVVTPQRTLNVESRPNKLYSSESVNSPSNIKARFLPAPRSIHQEPGLELPLIDPIALIAGGGKYSGDIVGDIIGETIGKGMRKIVRSVSTNILKRQLKSELKSNLNKNTNLGIDSWTTVNKPSKYIRNPYSATWDDFLTEPKLGKYFAEGGEAEVYESFDNPGYLTKIKLKIPEEGTTLEDLEYAVNRDLKINELPGTEPIIYKGFSTPEIIRRSLNQDTRFVSDEFVPIWELRKLLPTSKVNFKAFNVDPMQVVNDFANKHGYKRNVDGSWQFGKIKLTDLAIKNFAFDSFGNLKFIDPMIQMF